MIEPFGQAMSRWETSISHFPFVSLACADVQSSCFSLSHNCTERQSCAHDVKNQWLVTVPPPSRLVLVSM